MRVLTCFNFTVSPPLPPSLLQVMRAWAKAEFERDNVGNARILLAEALRRSPGVQPLYVLAGNVELTAGNLGVCVHVCAGREEGQQRGGRAIAGLLASD